MPPQKRRKLFDDDERDATEDDRLDKNLDDSEVDSEVYEVEEGEEDEWENFTESYPNDFPKAFDFPPLPEEGGGLLKFIMIQQRDGELRNIADNEIGNRANVAPVTRAELEFLAISQNW